MVPCSLFPGLLAQFMVFVPIFIVPVLGLCFLVYCSCPGPVFPSLLVLSYVFFPGILVLFWVSVPCCFPILGLHFLVYWLCSESLFPVFFLFWVFVPWFIVPILDLCVFHPAESVVAHTTLSLHTRM